MRGVVLIALALAISAGPTAMVAAAELENPDWPCIQRLVPELAASQMWAGLPPQAIAGDRQADPELAALAAKLASRDTPTDEAEAAIDRFAQGLAPDHRQERITQLFQSVLARINQERSEIIAGIERYTRTQRRLAEKIAQDGRRLQDLQPGTVPDTQTQELLAARKWDVRVFRDRQKMLPQICDQPVLLEQRAFALARALQAQLEPK